MSIKSFFDSLLPLFFRDINCYYVSKPIPKTLLYVVALAVYPDVGGDVPSFLGGLQDLGNLSLAGVPGHLQGGLALARHLVQSQAGAAHQSHHRVRHPLGDGWEWKQSLK